VKAQTQFDISVVGELNLDLVLYGLPEKLELDREHLATELGLTLGSSSAIFAHNFALLGNRVGFSSAIGDDPILRRQRRRHAIGRHAIHRHFRDRRK